MGQKVHPYGFRLGFNKPWRSRWFAKQGYAKLLQEDLELKEDAARAAEVGRRQLDRSGPAGQQAAGHHPHLAARHHHRPQGRGDREAEAGHGQATKREVFIDIQEVHKPELDAQLVSESIALQLEKRVAFRRAMRKAVDSALRFGCKGIKVRVSGRLNGAEIARSEWYLQGQLPLHTLRADIDYGFSRSAHHLRRDRHQGVALQGRDSGPDQAARRACCPSRSRGATAASGATADRGATAATGGDRRRARGSAAGAGGREPRVRPCRRRPADLPRPAVRPSAPILPPLMCRRSSRLETGSAAGTRAAAGSRTAGHRSRKAEQTRRR